MNSFLGTALAKPVRLNIDSFIFTKMLVNLIKILPP